MLKIFTIFILLFFLYLSAYPQIQRKDFKLSYPENISLNASFDVSLITSNRFPDADTFKLYIMPGERILLNNLKLNSIIENINLTYNSVSLGNYSGLVYEAIINLKDSALSRGNFFQVLMNFKNDNIKNSDVKFFGEFKKGDEVLSYLDSQKKSEPDDESDFINEKLNFYKPQNTAGKSVIIKKNASLKFELKNINTENNILVEFWLRLNNPKAEILNVNNNSDLNFNFSTNAFQIFACESKKNHQIFSKPDFVSLNSWTHVSILFSFKKNKLYFYNNDVLCSEYELPPFMNNTHLKFNFGSSNEKNNFQLDQLRFINFNNSIEKSFKNKNFANFAADSSSIISQFDFNSLKIPSEENTDFLIVKENLQYVKSDAPIFAKAPELNITMLSHSYELEWNGGDYKQAERYVLERSQGKTDYVPIFRIQAENQSEKKYSFLDKKDESTGILYYRVKQVDKDGSVSYSSQVKVGQGTLEPFAVEQNYPNPFNPKTSITVDLYEDTELKVIVYNLEGKEIVKLFNGTLSKGVHNFSFDASDQPSGVYLYKIETPKFSQTKKMILTK